MTPVDQTHRITPGNEGQFLELVVPSWMVPHWAAHFKGLNIKSVLDLGMGHPVGLFLLARYHDVEQIEDIERESQEKGLIEAKRSFPAFADATSIHEVFIQLYKITAASRFDLDRLLKASLRWDQDLTTPAVMPEKSSYDLVIMSNLWHYFEQPSRQRTIAKLRPILDASRYIYIHIKERPGSMEGKAFDLDGLLVDMNDLAQDLGLRFYGPYSPFIPMRNGEPDEGLHYTWTNLTNGMG